MAVTIKCKKCGSEIEISEALEHQIQEQALEQVNAKHKLDLEQVRKAAEASALTKVKEDFELAQRKAQENIAEEKERNRKLQEEMIGLTKEIRESRRMVEDSKLEMAKKLAQEEEKIRRETLEKSAQEHELKDREKEKKLQDALKVNEELRKKLEQGSQQTQGEVLELALEQILKEKFPHDLVTEVAKGVRGADILQHVIDKNGRDCGTILWESKNAKWSAGWIGKLREDQRAAKANVAVLVSMDLPPDIKTFVFRDGVWITGRQLIEGVAWALRFNLAQLYQAKVNKEGKNEKMEYMFQYLTGPEFVHRMEAIVEAFTRLQADIEKEKRWFTTKWANQEKEIRKIIDNTHGLYGDLQGVTGRSLPEIKAMQLDEPGEVVE